MAIASAPAPWAASISATASPPPPLPRGPRIPRHHFHRLPRPSASAREQAGDAGALQCRPSSDGPRAAGPSLGEPGPVLRGGAGDRAPHRRAHRLWAVDPVVPRGLFPAADLSRAAESVRHRRVRPGRRVYASRASARPRLVRPPRRQGTDCPGRFVCGGDRPELRRSQCSAADIWRAWWERRCPCPVVLAQAW